MQFELTNLLRLPESNVYADLDNRLSGLANPQSFAYSATDEILAALGSPLCAQTWDGGEATDFSASSPWSSGPTQTNVYLTAMIVREACEVDTALIYLLEAGVFTGAATNSLGIYKPNEDGATLDLIAATISDQDFFKTPLGLKTCALNVGGPVLLESGLYYGALCWNRSAQTTPPRLLSRSSSTAMANLLVTSPNGRSIHDVGLNSMASVITLTNCAQNAFVFWMGFV